MSDKLLGFIYLFLMTILIGVSTLFGYFLAGGFLAFFMFMCTYLFVGFIMWIACLPGSGYYKDFLQLFFGWYPVLIYKIYWEN